MSHRCNDRTRSIKNSIPTVRLSERLSHSVVSDNYEKEHYADDSAGEGNNKKAITRVKVRSNQE